MPVVMAKARTQIIFFMASPFFGCVVIAEEGKEIGDSHHVLEFQKEKRPPHFRWPS